MTDEKKLTPIAALWDDAENAPSVLFVCTQNAGRSQMAAGYLEELSGGRIRAFSAGTAPAEVVHPMAIAAMLEEGIDIGGKQPEALALDTVRESDIVITLDSTDAGPVLPGKRYEDWKVADTAGLALDEVRPIRDEIKRRILTLVSELLPAETRASA